MKIEIKPFDDRVRFTPPIIFMRPDKRPNAAKAGSSFFCTLTFIGKFWRRSIF